MQDFRCAADGLRYQVDRFRILRPILKIMFVSLGSFGHVEPYVDSMVRRGHQVSRLVFDPPTKSLGIPTYDISMGGRGDVTSSKWRYILSGLKARRAVRQAKPDILHAHYATSSGSICMLSGFRPYVVTIHGSDLMQTIKTRIWIPLLKCALRSSALINPVSEDLKRIVCGLGIPENRLMVASMGVDTARFSFKPSADRSNPTRVLCTRTLGTVYDPATIIRACRVALDRGLNLRVTLAANGPLRSEMERLAQELGVTEMVHFRGGFDNSEALTLLHEHDIYLSASQWDGTSISLLEAMAAGTFPVVSRIASNLGWLEDGRTALMFDVGNHHQLAEQLHRAINEAELRKHAALQNRQVVEERGDRERNMSLVEDSYYQVLAQRHRPGSTV